MKETPRCEKCDREVGPSIFSCPARPLRGCPYEMINGYPYFWFGWVWFILGLVLLGIMVMLGMMMWDNEAGWDNPVVKRPIS